jgi:hypothetical protein
MILDRQTLGHRLENALQGQRLNDGLSMEEDRDRCRIVQIDYKEVIFAERYGLAAF